MATRATVAPSIDVKQVVLTLETQYHLAQVSPFHQRGSGYGEGICRGICLDWIRRIMNGKSVIYAYDDPKSEKGKRRLALQARTQVELDKATAQFEAKCKHLQQERNESSREEESKKFWGGLKFWTKSAQELAQNTTQKTQELEKELDDFKRQGLISVSYDSFSSGWKGANQSKTGSPKKTQFDSFQVTQTPERDVSDAAKLGVYIALRLFGLQDGECVMFGITFQNGKGHAVAAHNSGTQRFFFDPNFGIFASTEGDPKNGIVYLFDQVYPLEGCVTKSIFALKAFR